MSENRIDPVTVANQAENARLASINPVSATGQPVLPPAWVPWITLVVALATVLPLIPGMPVVISTICGVIVAVGAVIGIASPGLRK